MSYDDLQVTSVPPNLEFIIVFFYLYSVVEFHAFSLFNERIYGFAKAYIDMQLQTLRIERLAYHRCIFASSTFFRSEPLKTFTGA